MPIFSFLFLVLLPRTIAVESGEDRVPLVPPHGEIMAGRAGIRRYEINSRGQASQEANAPHQHQRAIVREQPAHNKIIPKCMISSAGHDGFGHQLEAKLSCMAVASFLGMEYIHIPITMLEHGEDGPSLEQFLGVGKHFREETSIMNRFSLHPKEQGWLRAAELGKSNCTHDGQTIYVVDNCWDRFYYHGLQEAGYWYRMVPTLQQAYYSSPKPDLRWTDGFANQSWGKHVVVHIRQGDGSAHDGKHVVVPSYFLTQIVKLREELSVEGAPPLFRIQTDGSAAALITKQPEFDSFDIVFDEKSKGSFTLAFHRMVAADAFVMSMSALSMSAALLGNQSIVIMQCGLGRTALPHWRKDGC